MTPEPPSSSLPSSVDASSESSTCTHVLVSAEQVDQLRELSRKTRVAQSEYLREAVDNLLEKYQSVLS